MDNGLRLALTEAGNPDAVNLAVADSFSGMHARIKHVLTTPADVLVMLPCHHIVHARCLCKMVTKMHITKCPACETVIEFWFARFKASWHKTQHKHTLPNTLVMRNRI